MDEIHRKISHGFQVDATSLRGFANTLRGHHPHGCTEQYQVKFRDGSVQVFSSVEDVISLPNVGRKEVISIEIAVSSQSHHVAFSIEDVSADSTSNMPFSYDIKSDEPAWNKAVQVDCDDFVSSVRRNLMADWVLRNHSEKLPPLCLFHLRG